MVCQRKVCPNVGPKVMVRKKFHRFSEYNHHPQWGHRGTKNQRLKKNSVQTIRVSGDKFTKRLIMCCLYAPSTQSHTHKKFKYNVVDTALVNIDFCCCFGKIVYLKAK